MHGGGWHLGPDAWRCGDGEMVVRMRMSGASIPLSIEAASAMPKVAEPAISLAGA